MRFPITLPLANDTPRDIRLASFPAGSRYPFVLQVEVLTEAEASTVANWITTQQNHPGAK